MGLTAQYCFPEQQPPQLNLPTVNSDPLNRRTSFNEPSRSKPPSRHAHRRSAAMSEDLSGVDFFAFVDRRLLPSAMDRSSPSRPLNSDSDSDSSVSTPNCEEPPSVRSSASGPRVSFVDSKAHPRYLLDNVSTVAPQSPSSDPLSLYCVRPPSQLYTSVPGIPSPSTVASSGGFSEAEPNSPVESLSDSTSSQKQAQRLSFTKLFGSKKPRDSVRSMPPMIRVGPSTTPPEQYSFVSNSPTNNSPQRSFHEPEEPSIDLNEALGCQLPEGHGFGDQMNLAPESPYSKMAKRLSFIETVAEVDDEEEDCEFKVSRAVSSVTATSTRTSSPRRASQRFSLPAPRPKTYATPELLNSPSIMVANDVYATTSPTASSFSCESAPLPGDHSPVKTRSNRESHRRQRSLATLFGRSAAH